MTTQLPLRKKILFSALVFGVFLVACLIIYIFISSTPLYRYAKRQGKFSDFSKHDRPYLQFDPVLGVSLIPSSSTKVEQANGRKYVIQVDDEGMLSSHKDSPKENNGPVILALGCSFTFAAGCSPADSYCFKVAEGLGGIGLNAAVPSHGLAQMVLRAEELIPKHRPKFVLVQYSYWLADRSTAIYLPTQFGKVPGPYFYKSAGDSFALHPPAFQPSVFKVPIERFENSGSGLLDYLAFVAQVGAPVYGVDGFKVGFLKIQTATGIEPKPSSDLAAVEQFAYGRIQKICEANGAKCIFVGLASSMKPLPDRFRLLPESLRVDTHQYLIERLAKPDYAHYSEAYYHWADNPRRIIDTHPNARAHALIAERILQKIRADNP